MPAAVVARPPAKRVLLETTNTRGNIVASPQSSKKRKLDGTLVNTLKTSARGPNSSNPSSSQAKSHFEEEVLEKLTQDINGLKQKNSEKDQQWSRPPLGDFDEKTHDICFQQIDIEQGTLHGGKPTVKLFGVSEVRSATVFQSSPTLISIGWTLCIASCQRFQALFFCRGPHRLPTIRLRRLSNLS